MPLHLIIMGPPQAGKGTQAQRLTARFDLLHLATGDLLREISQERTERGRLINELLQRGEYVPDDIVTRLVVERMGDRNVLLDGYPRTIAQAEALDREGIPIHRVFVLDVPEAVLIGRAQDRLFCPNCGTVYSIEQHPPRVSWICDNCGNGLAQRVDDAPATVHRRMEVYRELSESVVHFYETRGLVRRIDGSAPIDEIATELAVATEKLLAGKRAASVVGS